MSCASVFQDTVASKNLQDTVASKNPLKRRLFGKRRRGQPSLGNYICRLKRFCTTKRRYRRIIQGVAIILQGAVCHGQLYQ